MGESLVELGDGKSDELKLLGWKLGGEWRLEWERGRWKGRQVPLLLVPVRKLVMTHWWVEERRVSGKVEPWGRV